MTYEILENAPIAPLIYRLRLKGETAALRAPGQFVQLQLPGFFLRRPISVCDWEETGMTLIYKVVGAGTKALSERRPGETLDLLAGLGNGYDLSVCGKNPLLIGGGVGVPPLYGLAKALLKNGVRPTAILGFNTKAEIFLREEFAALGVKTLIATADGSEGMKGFVTNAVAALTGYDYFFACGPEPMLKAVSEACPCSGQLSFEERMACGFGACMGCTCKTKYGHKRICKDGPVLRKEEVIW